MKTLFASLLSGAALISISLFADDGKDDREPIVQVNIEGVWEISRAAMLDGSPYNGTVTIDERDGIYIVEWMTDEANYEGLGLRYDNELFVGWGTPDSGVVVYDISENGVLEGDWTYPGLGGIGRERLTPTQNSTELAGRYSLTGTNIDGTQYSGSLMIEQNGDVYQLAWGGNAGPATGVGIRVGNRLIVGYGAETGLNGIAHYHFAEGAANGRWTFDDADSIGTENLARGTR